MRHLFCFILLSLFLTGCTHTHSASPHSTNLTLHARTLTFQPTRSDITVRTALLTIASTQPFLINGRSLESPYCAIALKPLGNNQFELPTLRIDHDPAAALCLSAKVWLDQASNWGDSNLYANHDDRYSLVSWWSADPGPQVGHRFELNRVPTLAEFNARLDHPIPLRFNNHPIETDWGYPEIPQPHRPPQSEIDAVASLLHDHPDDHLLAISFEQPDHARLIASIHDLSRYHGMREYKLSRINNTWHIDEIITHPNMSSFTWW